MLSTPDIADSGGVATPEFVRDVRTTLQVLTGRRPTRDGIRGGLAGGVSLTQDVLGTLRNGNGGTGQNSYEKGDTLFASSKNVLAKLAIGAVNTVMVTTDGALPSWGKVSLAMMATIANATVLGNSSGVAAIPAALTTLPTGVQDNITRLGTVVSGVWNGSVVGPTFGGTGLSSYAQGDLPYASAVNVLSKLAKNTTATRYLSNMGASNAPAWAQVDLTNGVTGILPLPNGGANAALTASNGGVVYSTATALAVLAGTATAGQMLRSGASGAPSWSTATWPSTVTVNQVLHATSSNVVGGASGLTYDGSTLAASAARVNGLLTIANGSGATRNGFIRNDNSASGITAGATLTLGSLVSSGEIIVRNATDGGTAIVLCDSVAGATVIADPSGIVAVGADPGAGTNKLWVVADGVSTRITNRYAATKSIDVTAVATN